MYFLNMVTMVSYQAMHAQKSPFFRAFTSAKLGDEEKIDSDIF